jgi:type II secretory pathway component PulC
MACALCVVRISGERTRSSGINKIMQRLRAVLIGALMCVVWSAQAQEARTTEAPTTGVLRAHGKTSKIDDPPRRSERLPVDEPLPLELNAGVISRAVLQSELASGIGRFLQQVRAEPNVTRGRFVGWRVVSLFPNRSDIRVQVLRPGDTVMRVNGQSIERPEQFMALWEGMAKASELVLDIQRDGRTSRLRYTIGP